MHTGAQRVEHGAVLRLCSLRETRSYPTCLHVMVTWCSRSPQNAQHTRSAERRPRPRARRSGGRPAPQPTQCLASTPLTDRRYTGGYDDMGSRSHGFTVLTQGLLSRSTGSKHEYVQMWDLATLVCMSGVLCYEVTHSLMEAC